MDAGTRRWPRRAVALGAVGAALSVLGACSRRSDVPAVRAALQAAADDGPELVRGRVGFQDSGMVGTVIDGVLSLAGPGEEETREQYLRLLQRVHAAYLEQPRTRKASVLLECHPEGDVHTVIRPTDVFTPSEGATVTTDDLTTYFS